MAAPDWLVTFETGGTQSFVFASNRLRESVGASYLVQQATTRWVHEALESEGLQARATMLQEASGKSFLALHGERREAERLVARVTRRALEQAPGLDVVGAIVVMPTGASVSELVELVRSVNRRIDEHRSRIPGAIARHLRLPLADDCASTPAAAATLAPTPGRDGLTAVSAAVAAKRAIAERGLADLRSRIDLPGEVTLPRSLDELERVLSGDEDDGLRWLAVVHADVNGLGQALMSLGRAESTDAYLAQMTAFSTAVEDAGTAALRAATSRVEPVRPRDSAGEIVPLLPLIAAGDDLTAVLPARDALQFIVTYLLTFEAESVRGVLGELAPGGRLGVSAGIAVVKPHHPFSDAYALSEKLADSAKQVKELVVDEHGASTPCSAFDFQVLRGTVGADLDRLRDDMAVDDGQTLLHGRPYVVTPDELLGELASEAREWVAVHRVESLGARHAALSERSERDPTRRRIPRSQVVALRSALAAGREMAAGRARELCARSPHLADVLFDGSEPFRPGVASEPPAVADLLDAIDVAEISSRPLVGGVTA